MGSLKDLLPQPPWVGPPLPRLLAQKWPWYEVKQTEDSTECDFCVNSDKVIAENREILRLHKEGLAATEIAARLNVAPELVRYRLRRAGLEPTAAPRFLKAERDRRDVVRLHQLGYPAK